MLKFEIEFNKEKISKENIYDINNLYHIVDEAFAKYNLSKIAKGTYRDNNTKDDYANMWLIVWTLIETDWFIPNISKLLWVESDDDNNSIYNVEDVLEYCKQEGLNGGHI